MRFDATIELAERERLAVERGGDGVGRGPRRVVEHRADQQAHGRSLARPQARFACRQSLSISSPSMMRDVDQLTVMFRDHGLRVTPQRQAIFSLLHGDDTHPTVESLFDRARRDIPAISLKTVYQTVHDLEALGEVRVLDLGTGSVRVDPNVDDDASPSCVHGVRAGARPPDRLRGSPSTAPLSPRLHR